MISAQAAKKLANSRLREEGAPFVADGAHWDKKHGVWVVAYRDPVHPEEVLMGGGLVVTDEGEVHSLGSAPGALDLLMDSLEPGGLGVRDDVWLRDGEGLAPLADVDPDEAAGLGAWAASLRPWPGVLGQEFEKPYFKDLMRFVDRERARGPVYPSPGEVFAAFHLTSFEEVKVVILGQDPYHQRGQANGLCFSVPGDVLGLPASLRNIHAAMVRDGFTPPAHGALTGWARQGVLLLNTALSVRDSEANSHAKQWRGFTDTVISSLSDRERPVVFVLWGKAAQSKRRLINEGRHVVVTAPHPAARGHSQRAFREAGTFAEVNRQLQALDRAPVEWGSA